MKILLLIIICICKVSYSQEYGHELKYKFNFPNKQHTLLLNGYKEKENTRFIYTSEFYVIDNKTSDTLIFFDALQDCLVDKNNIDSLIIIETKKMPLCYLGKWKDFKYLKYTFVVDEFSNIKIDTSLIFAIPKLTKSDKMKIVKEYEKAKAVNHVNGITEDLNYCILFLALNNDSWAKEKLLMMPIELILDGNIAEIYDDAMNIYKTCNYLNQKTKY